MRNFDEEYASAKDERAFSNSTEGDMWTGQNCDLCVHDSAARRGDPENGCVLLGVAFIGRTPRQWKDSDHGLVCEEFQES